MKQKTTLHFLGTGGAFAPELGNTSLWFTWNDDFVLVDCGESVFERLTGIDAFRRAGRILVVVTHMHGDHVGSLGTLCSYSALVSHQKLEIYHPDLERMRRYLDVVGIDPSFYQLFGQVPADWGLPIEPYEVVHAKDMHCYGYWFRDLGFYFSGDAADVPDVILAKFLQGEIPTLFEDTTTSPSTAHGALDRMETRIPPEVRHRYFAMHLPDRHAVGLLREKGFSVASCKECEMGLA